MKPSQRLRSISIVFAAAGLCLWLAQLYFGMTAPVLPYLPVGNEQLVESIPDPQRSGSLQEGDQVTMFNGRPIGDCRYLIDSPLYSAPRGRPIAISYTRPDAPAQASTTVVLTNPSIQDMLQRSPDYLMSFVFLLTGLIILVGGGVGLAQLLLGLAWLSFGVMYGGWENYFAVPLSLLAWWGMPVSALLVAVAHAVWPVNQWARLRVRLIVIAIGLICLTYLLSILPGSSWFGCSPAQAIPPAIRAIRDWSYLGMSASYPAILYLLAGAYRQTENPFARLQIRAITWAIGIGFGAPIVFALLEVPWGPLGDLTQFISGIAPLTYLFVLYRGQLLAIDRYLNRLVYVFLFFVFWIIVMLRLINTLLAWQPNLDPRALALSVALPSLLAASFVRDRLGMLVDLVLYGAYYNYETVVSQLGQSLAGAVDQARFAHVVTQQLPEALSIRQAALWLAEPDGQMRLAGETSEPAGAGVAPGAFPAGSAAVEVFGQPFRVGSDPRAWQAILRLHADNRLVGLILLGTKLRENSYNQRDVRTLQTLGGWMATTAANLAQRTEQERSAERERRLMLALAENEQRLTMGVARELHDRGISALGMVRLMVEQERGRAIVSAGLEQVIANLRELSDSQLSPLGLSQGLPQALEAMVEMQRELGLPVSLALDPGYADGEPPSALVTRELFYIAQEATVNALKHAHPSRVSISLARQDGMLQLSIHNDGSVFEVAPTLTGREAHGMGIMQARASRIGGRLTISSSAEAGTDVIVSIETASL